MKRKNTQHNRHLDLCRPYFEKLRWPNGPACFHCGEKDESKFTLYKGHRGVRRCQSCKKQFTPFLGTPFQGTHIPFHIIMKEIWFPSKNTYQLSLREKINYRSAMHLVKQVQEFLAIPYKECV